MPSQTFTNLDESKKRSILDAAIKEFSSCAFEQASIQHIIRDAGIPRGSFYQYFTDKTDVYDTVFEDIGLLKATTFLTCLRQHDGNIFEACEAMFRHEFTFFKDERYRKLIRHFCYDSHHRLFERLPINKALEEMWSRHKEMVSSIDFSILRTEDPETILLLVRFLVESMRDTLLMTDRNGWQEEEAAQYYAKAVNILKHGMMKPVNSP